MVAFFHLMHMVVIFINFTEHSVGVRPLPACVYLILFLLEDQRMKFMCGYGR